MARALARSSLLFFADHPHHRSPFLARRASTATPAGPAAAMAYTASTPSPPPLSTRPTHADGLAETHGAGRPALYSPSAPPLSFGALAAAAARVAGAIRAAVPEGSVSSSPDGNPTLPLCGPRVAILARPGPLYAAALWGAWAAGCVAVPLHAPYPPPALAHPVADAGCVAVLVGGGCAWPGAVQAVAGEVEKKREETGEAARPLALLDLDAAVTGGSDAPPLPPPPPPTHGAVMLYTSGTTGPPKGALHTGAGLGAQAASLTAAWRLGTGDLILNALPLHHIHGLVNALITPLAAGAAVELAPAFSPTAVWAALTRGLGGEGGNGGEGGGVSSHLPAVPPPPTVLMAVPTMYAYLLDAYDAMPPAQQALARAGVARLRLAVCGSAACPAPTAERWAGLAGGVPLLERYGMTEAGMILGQGYDGERVRGTVGVPMPGVSVGVVPAAVAEGDAPHPPSSSPTTLSGELLVRWPGLFAGYWRRPDATAAAFTSDGWFKTGDVVAVEGGGGREGTPGVFSILGRASTDILKVGGFKVSALQVEDALLAHPGVAGAAVVGIPGGARGDAVAAAVVVRGGEAGTAATPAALSAWVAGRLPPAAVPKAEHVLLVPSLPRNALGKVDKPGLRKVVFGQDK